ncbi:MAG: aspartate/glutamate racemase family protein [Dehalococcoidia bacterium]|nr:aspartate/glutamate racemase family protein [Dehalococcoidia bacterium]
MNSRRTRIGLIVPSSNSTAEYDYQRILDAETALHTARVFLVDTTIEMLERMNQDAEEAARSLESAGVDVIAYACTSGSFLGGPGYDDALLARVSDAARGTKAVGTTPAVIDALHAMGLRRVAVVTPYIDSINERLAAFFEDKGFDIASMAGQQLVANLDIGDQTPEQIAAFAKQHMARDVDGFFLSCTNWRAMEVVEELERELGKPVVTSNQATIWASLRAVGRTAPVDGFGALLRTESGAVSAG